MSNRILLVDDQTVILRILSAPLEAEGFQVITATSGAEALYKVQTGQPDLIILDVMLPDTDGFAICHAIRYTLNLLELPVIILSGLTEIESKIKGLEAGADEYLTKPVDPKEMILRVKTLLMRSQRLQQTQQPPATNHTHGKSIAFMGAKGGVGTTSVVLNVALALAARQRRVIGIELRSFFGTFAKQLGLIPHSLLTHLMRLDAGDITEQQTTQCLIEATGGIRVLVAPQRAADYSEFEPKKTEALLHTIAEMADYAVIDLPHMPSSTSRIALQKCQQAYLVLESESSAVAAGIAMLELWNEWGIQREMIKVIMVNRSLSPHTVAIRDIERELGCEIGGVITNASDLMGFAMNVGKPLVLSARDSLAARTMDEIAERIITKEARTSRAQEPARGLTFRSRSSSF